MRKHYKKGDLTVWTQNIGSEWYAFVCIGSLGAMCVDDPTTQGSTEQEAINLLVEKYADMGVDLAQ